MDEDEDREYGGTSLDKCIEQMTEEKMIGTLLDTMKIMGDKKMILVPQYWGPAFELIVREGTEEDYGRFVSALDAIYEHKRPKHDVYMETADVLEVITRRGLTWLPRIMEVVDLESRTLLWAKAIRDDFPHLGELREILHSSENFFVFNVVTIVDVLAGTEDIVEKIERWVPLALEWEFLNAGEDYWSTFMKTALHKKDARLAKILLEKTPAATIVPFLLAYWKYFYRCDDMLPYALDLVSDTIRERRLGENARELKKLARRYMTQCEKDAVDPDPAVVAHLVKPASKGAL